VSGHGYTWDQVRERPAADLKVGDTFVRPGTGTAYRTCKDGSVRGVGWQDLDGTAWTLIAREGDTTTARSHDGREASQAIPPGARVLAVIAKAICTRCKRELRPWPLERGDRCSPKRWAHCIRRLQGAQTGTQRP
jgi:hypothetical protein